RQEVIADGSIHLIGVTFASPGINLDDADLPITEFTNHSEMKLSNLSALNASNTKGCHRLDILAVLISPSLPSSLLPLDCYYEVQLHVNTVRTEPTTVPCRISHTDLQIPTDLYLESLSSSTLLYSGITNTFTFALQPLKVGV
uniref:Integrin_alpha2 domain-containing protein n=1 Tax=Mesocestoides corti TaxID=53468 RepID=A0A5K3FWX2_MESCO